VSLVGSVAVVSTATGASAPLGHRARSISFGD
jgi:hypothetical protein